MNRLPALLLALASSMLVRAEMILVPADQPTIAEAFLASQDADTIIVAGGIHEVHELVPPGHRTLASEYLLTGDSLSIRSTTLTLSPSAPLDSGSLFHINAGSSLELIGLDILSNRGTLYTPWGFTVAGAIFLEGGTLTARRCIFRNGTAELGSAMWLHNNSLLHLDSCFFYNHDGLQGTLLIDSSSAIITHTVFRRNRQSHGITTLGLRHGWLRMSCCLIDSNGTDFTTAAAVVIGSSRDTVYIDSSDFIANTMYPQGVTGPALISYQNAITRVSHCRFIHNFGRGAPLTLSAEGCTADHCLFLENESSQNPAGIFCQLDGSYRISNCRFEGNRALASSVFYSHGITHVDSCEFFNNIATGYDSGAAVLCSDYGGVYSFRSCVFMGNIPGAVHPQFEPDREDCDFAYCYWGDASGPYHSIENPDGQGDRIFGEVIFQPWLTEPPLAVRPEPKPRVPHDGDWIFAYPNPFNSQIRLSVNATREIRQLLIFDLQGRRVEQLPIAPFQWQVTWDAGSRASGVFFAVLGSARQKLLLIK